MRFRGEFSLREFSWVRFAVVSLPDAARRLAAVQRLIKPYRTRVARTRPVESGRLQLGAKARSEHHRVRPAASDADQTTAQLQPFGWVSGGKLALASPFPSLCRISSLCRVGWNSALRSTCTLTVDLSPR